MTTKDAIKLLPIDEKLKIQILNTYEYLEPGQKLAISRIAWKTYFFLYEEAIEENKELQFDNVKEGKGKLGENFYESVLEKTNQELTSKVDQSLQSTDLSVARQAMQQIINEIRASKKPKAVKNTR